MKLGRAVVVGACGAAVVLLSLWGAQRFFGVAADLGDLFGELALPDGGVVAWVVGTLAQLVVGAVSGVVYAAVFEHVFRRAGPLAGLAVAVPHVAFAGVAVGFLFPPPWAGAPTRAVPGAFLAFRGGTAVTCFVAAHLLFGVLVGWWYGASRHRATAPSSRWRELPATRDASEPEHR